MREAFQKYAEYYDLIYRDKDYERECDFLEEIFRTYQTQPVRSILELGCGTGGHAIPLAKRGYKLTGLDASSVMLKQAEKKSRKAGVSIKFLQTDMRQYDLHGKFDTVIAMFAVVNYVTSNTDLRNTFTTVRRHINQGSLFVFDVWNGLAVVHLLPSTKLKVVQDADVRVFRLAEPEMQADRHLCLVHYKMLVTQKETLIGEVDETHTIRYLFPLEVTHYLDDAGFEVLKICPFLNLPGRIDENEWNMAVIARAI